MAETTARLSETPTQRHRPASNRSQHLGKLTPDSVALYIWDSAEPVILTVPHEIIFGRYSPNNPMQPNLDLTRYNAYQFGVSRLHATLHRTDDNRYMISDRASGNGTYLNGQRLTPFTASHLTSGDQVKLGHLEIEIYLGVDEVVNSPAAPVDMQTTPAIPTGLDSAPSVQASLSALSHFHGTLKVDSGRVFSQLGLVAEQVVEPLAATREANVRLTIKIEAIAPNGFDEATVRLLTALCESLKFSHTAFDSEK